MNGIYEEIRIALHAIWQRRWLALAVAWGVAVLGWLVIALIPASYTSQARIYIQQETVLSNQVGVTDREQRAMMERIRQTLASTGNLEQVVRETDLAQQATTDAQVRSLASQLRQNITVAAQQDPNNIGRPSNVFEISASWSGPSLAQQINQKLIDVFIEESLAGTRQEATQSVAFLDRQIAERETRLQQIEERRANFENEFSGSLPGVGTISQRMDQARSEMQNIENDLAAAQSSLNIVQAQLAGTPATTSVPGTFVPGGGNARLNALQSQLADAQARGWTDQHPDVVALRSQIARARAQGGGGGGGRQVGGSTSANPLYTSLRSMLADRQATVAALTARRDQLRAGLDQIERQRRTNPGALAEQQQLDRDYLALQTQYNQLVADRERLRLRGEVVTETDSNTFRVINPPSMPSAPTAPNRPLLLILVLMAAIAAGIGAAFAQSQLKTSYPTARRLGNGTGLPVLGAISEIISPTQKEVRHQNFRRFAAGTAALFGVFVLLMVVEFVQRGLAA
ncbi:XrtA system polysaccharide chain length determinant [Parasphingopyxis lamellibrachiae]|uniref:Polysaccharide chain length determinant protein (PEP-CTERM system associated) n=1 Tax=Parasphingopyxis lamellibrachiae TaxID=680125 RepID=A0A3D9FCY2_9SPHN|nr:XrtA system polysaccharide chain length determinant [Parasphingopyxis lamellibrachiae]RED15670.1 polysaccharide chain length determinant protein (PEP-CTERM system associated) [Parasphingopyxis lamellibrachiae]